MRLTDEQIESILARTEPELADLDRNDHQRLAEARAVRDRLKSAFASTIAGASLAERISASLKTPPARSPRDAGRRRRAIWLTRHLVPVAAAAAAVFVVAVVLEFGAEPAPGPAELVRIHNDNLTAAGQFVAEADADRIAEHFREHLGFAPRICPHDEHTALKGGCVARFRGRKAATYLLAADDREISVVVTDEPPDAMGLTCKCGCGMAECRCFHTGQCSGCNIVSVRIAGHSYTAVGAAPPEQLKDILARLRT